MDIQRDGVDLDLVLGDGEVGAQVGGEGAAVALDFADEHELLGAPAAAGLVVDGQVLRGGPRDEVGQVWAGGGRGYEDRGGCGGRRALGGVAGG